MRNKDFDEEEVLRKAVSLFWEKGYNATSMHDLINELGIGRSSIYHAFGDKHHLFVKALELYQNESTNNMLSLLHSNPSAKQAIADLLYKIIDDVLSSSCQKGCFKVNTEVEMAAHDELVKKMLADNNNLIEKGLAQTIERGQRSGEIPKTKSAKALARFICNTVTGLRVYARVRNDRHFFKDIIDTTLSVLD